MSDPHWTEQPARPHEETAVERPPTALEVVARRIAEVSPAWDAVTIDPSSAPPAHATDDLGRDHQQGFEAIREGWLLHRGQSRLAAPAGPDLALLIGDWCYAAGLCTIAEHGELDDVAALAELVADVAARSAEPVEALLPRWNEGAEALQHG